MTAKLLTIVGARPQFVKAAAISRAIAYGFRDSIREVLVHTGQHYDDNLSQIFFDELEIPAPQYNLKIAAGSHGAMTGRMLEEIERVLVAEQPDWMMVYGDTNSTLAGALAAAKLHVPVAHVEAGLRSFNMRMPEEINRILTDKVSTLLLCPTSQAVANLHAEGIKTGIHSVGDVMHDVALFYGERARRQSSILDRLGLTTKSFVLATCHRAENTDDKARLTAIIEALCDLSARMPVILPLHPRTHRLLQTHGLADKIGNIVVLEPLPYLDMVALEQAAYVICTDSGGVQKEAYFFDVPCVTMRDETEWVELVQAGGNQLAGADRERIKSAVKRASTQPKSTIQAYGDGHTAEKILNILIDQMTDAALEPKIQK